MNLSLRGTKQSLYPNGIAASPDFDWDPRNDQKRRVETNGLSCRRFAILNCYDVYCYAECKDCMSQQDLSDYIKRAREQHASDETIRSQLLKFGWSPVEIDSSLGQKEEAGVTLPPPPAPHVGMWISFQYVLLFIALYIAATSLGGILNLAADKNITDPLDNINYYSSSFSPNLVRGYMAALLVAYPIFAFLFLRLTSQLLSKPFLRGLRARKILIYLTLVITFIIMISHIIYILYNLLSGSVTGRSAAHLGVTLLIAGSIFGYLLQDVREDRKGL